MLQDRWTAVDRYITGLFAPPDPALDAALRRVSVPLLRWPGKGT